MHTDVQTTPDPCPVRCAGLAGTDLCFISPMGRAVIVAPGDLARSRTLRELFDGQEGWLRWNFPAGRYTVTLKEGGGTVVPLGIDRQAAAQWLTSACVAADAAARAAPPRRGWLRRILDWLFAPPRAAPGQPA